MNNKKTGTNSKAAAAANTRRGRTASGSSNSGTKAARRELAPGELSAIRSAAGMKGHAKRWGAPRPDFLRVSVDADAVQGLRSIPESDRRRVASDAIRKAVAEYFGK